LFPSPALALRTTEDIELDPIYDDPVDGEGYPENSGYLEDRFVHVETEVFAT
jgi:hypothetical protein